MIEGDKNFIDLTNNQQQEEIKDDGELFFISREGSLNKPILRTTNQFLTLQNEPFDIIRNKESHDPHLALNRVNQL